MSDGREDPARLGRHRILRRLGQGAMGVVYLGEDPRLDRRVAIKTLQVAAVVDAEAAARLKQRFVHEPRITARLRHPNVVPVYDTGVDEATGIAWIALEHVEGQDLSRLLGRPLPPARVAELARDLAAALDHAHEQGVVHRDVKPANVLIDVDGRARLTDFGIAHEVDADRTRPGELLGSPAYMAPEQLGGGRVSAATDVHALAAVLYEALVGRRPFEASTNVTTAQAVLSSMPEPPSRIDHRLPPALDAVFARAFAKAPDERHASAGELAAAVESALEEVGAEGSHDAADPDADTAVVLDGHGGGLATRVRRGAGRAARSLRDAWRRAGRRTRWGWPVAAALVVLTVVVAWAVVGRGNQDGARAGADAPGAAASDASGATRAGTAMASSAGDRGGAGGAAGSGSEGEAAASVMGGADATTEAPASETVGATAASADDGERSARPRDASAATVADPSPDGARGAADGRRSSARSSPAPSEPGSPRTAGTERTRLYIDLHSSKDGVLILTAGDRELLRARPDDMRRMPTSFRAFGKPRYRSEVEVPSDARLTIRFEPDKDVPTLETEVRWDLPPGGDALVAVEVGLRGKDLDVQLVETAR